MTANQEDCKQGHAAVSASLKPHWHHSLLGKITLFLLTGIIGAYVVGAFAGWVMVERSSLELWRRQAEMNAQSASFAIRNVYTFVAVETDRTGQVTRIVSERPLGDEQSILDTGFNPGDVLALVASQTKNDVWLFQRAGASPNFVTVADADNEAPGKRLDLPKGTLPTQFYSGFAAIGVEKHFVALMPVVTPSGEVTGAVATSIGKADELYLNQKKLLRNSLLVLIGVLIVTVLFVTILMRQLLRPVPALIQALRQIAQNETGNITPFQTRGDEIGSFAIAIETVREAVVERENLLQVREVAKEFEHLAHHDALTGLPNRALFSRQIEKASGLLSNGILRFNVMLLDLDRFKDVNDTHGHAVGDALLIAVSERMSLLLGPEDLPARLGGDEFAILQKVRENPLVEGARLAEGLVASMARPFAILGHDVSVGVSVGIATAPLQGTVPGILLKNADIALYRSKSAGRNTFHFFKKGMAMEQSGPSALERDLELAVEREQLELHYQPIFRTMQGDIAGYEALVRWRHPQMGLLSPDKFIGIAEETGLIVLIGKWVLQQACRDAVLLAHDATMSVNVSVRQLQTKQFVEDVKSALAESSFRPEQLLVEVTESLVIADDTVVRVLAEVHALGVGIVLDDFGTGQSSLTSLMSVPVQAIKIDRSFVVGMDPKSKNQALVAGTVELAHKMGLKVTAEGVETEEQLSILRSLGCDLAQGYLLGPPTTVSSLLETDSLSQKKFSFRGNAR
jgi:diguanylate cyclase (GGDEF)-like protein